MSDEIQQIALRLMAADEFGALHVVVSDGNMEDEFIEACRNRPNATAQERELCRDLLQLPFSARVEAWELANST